MWLEGLMSSAVFNSLREGTVVDDRPNRDPPPGGPPQADDLSVAKAARPPFPKPKSARGADRRGPFRPLNLISSRARLHGETIARVVRSVDVCAIVLLVWVVFDFAEPHGVWRSAVGEVTPIFGAALLLIGAMGVLEIYSLRARESLANHLAKVGAAFLFAIVIMRGDPLGGQGGRVS